MGHELENSMASFKKAVQLGVEMIEFDVRLTADRIPIVFHDYFTRRLTGKQGLISRITLDRIPKFPLNNGEKVPTLDEVCEFISSARVQAYIEVKVRDRRGIIISKALEHFPPEQFYIGSFDRTYLANIERHYPEVRTIAITFRKGKELARFIETGEEDCFSVQHRSITPEIVEIVRRRDKKIFAWTANKPEDIARVKSLGIDGIVSDFPERIK